MTNTTQQASSPLTLARALEVQDLMVRRGMLTARAHDVANGTTDADDRVWLQHRDADGDVLLECTCGRTMLIPADGAQRTYALHVSSALGITLGLAA